MQQYPKTGSSEFGKMFEQYRTSFINLAYFYVSDRMVAEDIVMDCFTTIWEKRDKIDIGGSFKAYFLRAVKWRCLEWLKERRRHLTAHDKIHSEIADMLEINIRSLESCEPHDIFASEVMDILEKSMAKMQPQTRDVLIAHKFNGLTYDEISKLFGLSSRQVKYEIEKSIKILIPAMKDYLPLLVAGISLLMCIF